MTLRRRTKAARTTGHELFPGFVEVVEIGVGSLATVYRAREIDTGRLVALKLLNVRDASPRAIESFERESIALGSLSSHPNIVTLFRTFRTPDGRPVLVLELCSGAVADRLQGGVGLPVQDAVSIGIKVAGALETAHRGGILHRDVKPQNILVTEFGEPALADFGVAMLQSATQTTAGLFDFTTLHAAPELLEGGGTSAATDVYELASSLYQLIAGASAFRAYEGESPASVILRILRDPVRPLMGAGVPVQLSDLLIRAMSKDKEARPPTAAEFAAELAEMEIAQGWPRTQFLIRGPGGSAGGWVPDVVRLPDAVPRTPPRPPVLVEEPVAKPVGLVPQAPQAPLPPAVPVTTPKCAPVPVWAPPPPPLPARPPEPRPVPEPQPVEPDPVCTPDPSYPPVLGPEPGANPVEPEPEPAPEPPELPSLPRSRVPIDEDLGSEIDLSGPASWWSPVTPEVPPAEPAPAAYPVPPAAAEPHRPVAAAVPQWAVRTPTPQFLGAAPQFVGDIAIDPASLRPRMTVRSGLSSLTVDEHEVTLRRLLSRERLSWAEINAFEPHFPDGVPGPQERGVLLAITPAGAVELPATRRLGGELRHLHAVLDAYRIRGMQHLSA